jgi:hypothetical protein
VHGAPLGDQEGPGLALGAGEELAEEVQLGGEVAASLLSFPGGGGEAGHADRHPGVVSRPGAPFPATGPGLTGEESANTSTP